MKRTGFFKNFLNEFTSIRFRSLRVIIALSFIAVMFAVYSITYYMVSQKFQQVNQTNMENMSIQVAGQVENTVKNYLSDIMDVSNYILFQYYMKQNGEEGTMEDILQAVLSSREDLETILLLDSRGSVLAGSQQSSLKDGADITSQQWFLIQQNHGQEIYFSEPHVQNLYYGTYPWVVTVSRNTGIYNIEKSAVLMMDIRMDELAKKIESVGLGGRGYVYLMDKYGNLIYHPNLQYIHYGLVAEDTEFALNRPDGSYLREINGEQVYTVIQTSAYTGWKTVVVNYLDIMVPQSEITGYLVWTILLGLLVIAVMSWVISVLVSRPVLRLEESMASVEQGNFDNLVDVRGDREVERLSSAFNKMVAKIKALMGEIVHEQEEKRKSELKALQMQIHPHFLYNTLESVIWMAENGKNDDVVTMVSALAKLFRISLYKGMDSVPVEQELAHAENYLIIQKMRYRDKITYEIEADEDAKKCLTIKLILQPIVENAIYHGIKDIGDTGFIKISAAIAGGRLVFKVHDNGVGMSRDMIERIFEKGFVATSGSGVGVKNVHERIRLHYGPEYGISIESEEGVGTTVTLALPCIKEAP